MRPQSQYSTLICRLAIRIQTTMLGYDVETSPFVCVPTVRYVPSLFYLFNTNKLQISVFYSHARDMTFLWLFIYFPASRGTKWPVLTNASVSYISVDVSSKKLHHTMHQYIPSNPYGNTVLSNLICFDNTEWYPTANHQIFSPFHCAIYCWLCLPATALLNFGRHKYAFALSNRL